MRRRNADSFWFPLENWRPNEPPQKPCHKSTKHPGFLYCLHYCTFILLAVRLAESETITEELTHGILGFLGDVGGRIYLGVAVVNSENLLALRQTREGSLPMLPAWFLFQHAGSGGTGNSVTAEGRRSLPRIHCRCERIAVDAGTVLLFMVFDDRKDILNQRGVASAAVVYTVV